MTSIRDLRKLLPKWLRQSNPTFSRQYVRYPCEFRASMRLVEVGADLTGMVLEISQGGCSFRPASMFLLERNGEEVEIHGDGFAIAGVIRATRPEAYGVQFQKALEDPVLLEAMRRAGAEAA